MPQIDLEQITIASPCTADWDAMQGDERVRFCGQCELNVYNLSAMEREEAQAFVRESEGKVCVRMFKRRDGTVITQDCPVGLRAILRRRLSWLAALPLYARFGRVRVVDEGGDVYAYCNNDIGADAPEDAALLQELLSTGSIQPNG